MRPRQILIVGAGVAAVLIPAAVVAIVLAIRARGSRNHEPRSMGQDRPQR